MAAAPWFFAAANARTWNIPIEDAEAILAGAGARVLHRSVWRRAFYAYELLVVER
jgi:hypothetical protein